MAIIPQKKLFGWKEMEKRRLGRTEHMSSIVSFGGAVFMKINQDEADRTMKLVFEHGINHLDVAPHYGEAEIRIGPSAPG